LALIKKDLFEEAYTIIKEMIMEGSLKPSEKLVQEQIAQKLGISRTPVMHALRILETEGLLTINPRTKVMCVRDLSREELVTIFEIRLCIEPLATRYACQVITDEAVEGLEKSFTTAFKTMDEKEYRRLDNKFHTYISEICPNRDLKDFTIRSGLISRFLIKGLIRPPQETYYEHLQVLEAFRKKQPQEAEKAMRKHIEITLAYIQSSGKEE